ncbi:MAG: hypothetical protein H6Q92_341, partial [Nitrospirae bacterium]|nr:hypothetical protein [Nitrospirota bacterium]
LKGFEPLTHCLEGSCSIRLSYRRGLNQEKFELELYEFGRNYVKDGREFVEPVYNIISL